MLGRPNDTSQFREIFKQPVVRMKTVTQEDEITLNKVSCTIYVLSSLSFSVVCASVVTLMNIILKKNTRGREIYLIVVLCPCIII